MAIELLSKFEYDQPGPVKPVPGKPIPLPAPVLKSVVEKETKVETNDSNIQ